MDLRSAQMRQRLTGVRMDSSGILSGLDSSGSSRSYLARLAKRPNTLIIEPAYSQHPEYQAHEGGHGQHRPDAHRVR